MNDFPGLARALPLREQIHQQLRAAILTGEYAPGTPLVEAELAAKLGASRTPVREALQRLETEGLLERREPRGIVVRELREDEVACIFEIREALEGLAARRACRLMTGAQLDALRAVVAAMARAVNDADMMDRLDADFHDRVLEAADGVRLRRMLGDLRGELVTYRFLAMSTAQRRAASVAECAAIVAAFESRDGAEAAALMTQHIANARDAATAHVRARALAG